MQIQHWLQHLPINEHIIVQWAGATYQGLHRSPHQIRCVRRSRQTNGPSRRCGSKGNIDRPSPFCLHKPIPMAVIIVGKHLRNIKSKEFCFSRRKNVLIPPSRPNTMAVRTIARRILLFLVNDSLASKKNDGKFFNHSVKPRLTF